MRWLWGWSPTKEECLYSGGASGGVRILAGVEACVQCVISLCSSYRGFF